MVFHYLWPIHIRNDSFYPGLGCGGSFFYMRSCFGFCEGFWSTEVIPWLENLSTETCRAFLAQATPMSCHLSEWPRAVVHGNELIPPGRLQGKKSWACRRTWNILGVKHTPNASPVNTQSLTCSSQSQDSSVSCKTDGLSPVCAFASLVVFF